MIVKTLCFERWLQGPRTLGQFCVLLRCVNYVYLCMYMYYIYINICFFVLNTTPRVNRDSRMFTLMCVRVCCVLWCRVRSAWCVVVLYCAYAKYPFEFRCIMHIVDDSLRAAGEAFVALDCLEQSLVRFLETQDCLERSLARFCEAAPATSVDEAELVTRAALLERRGALLRGARPAR